MEKSIGENMNFGLSLSYVSILFFIIQKILGDILTFCHVDKYIKLIRNFILKFNNDNKHYMLYEFNLVFKILNV